MDSQSVKGPGRRRHTMSRLAVSTAIVCVIVSGCANYVLFKATITTFGDRRAFFVTQAINVLYLFYGGIALYPRMLCTDHITVAMYNFPKRHFVVMGVLDGLTGLLLTVGTVYTPGSLTLLLNQLLIPFTMLVSYGYLRTRYSREEKAGAGLIVSGACISALTHLLQQQQEDEQAPEARWYAIALYALAHLPLAISAVYKEATFDDEQLDIWYVTQWISIVQFFVSYLLLPVIALPGFGSREGMSLHEVRASMVDGFRCFLEVDDSCREQNAFLLLMAFCGANVAFTTAQLYLTKYGSAVLSALGSSMLMPITTALFFAPILGAHQEPLTRSSALTITGLLLTLAGFFVYQRFTNPVDDCHSAQWSSEYKKLP